MKNVFFWNSLNCLHLEIPFNHIYTATFFMTMVLTIAIKQRREMPIFQMTGVYAT